MVRTFSRTGAAASVMLMLLALETQALPLLPSPTADDLSGPFFVQPFAGLEVISASGETEPFFSDLPDGSMPNDFVVNILGNFQAFDPLGAPTPFSITSVSVTDASTTFTPVFGELDFAGNSSVTFTDSIDFDQVTFFASDFTLAFPFISDAALDYEYTLFTNLPVGSSIVFDDSQVSPEPSTALLFGAGLAALALRRRRHRMS